MKGLKMKGDSTIVVDGVKVTLLAYRKPKSRLGLGILRLATHSPTWDWEIEGIPRESQQRPSRSEGLSRKLLTFLQTVVEFSLL